MKSSKKKAKPSVERSMKLSPRPDGLRLQDGNVLYKPSEMDWLVRRAGNQERILRECRKNPVALLEQIEGFLEAQASTHADDGRNTDAVFYGTLGIYVENLRRELDGRRPKTEKDHAKTKS
jgi:hypothetical protein